MKRIKRSGVTFLALAILLSSSIFSGGFVAEAAEAKIRIGGIIAYDSIKDDERSKEPKTVDEIWNLMENRDDKSTRTGWSAAIFECNINQHFDEMGQPVKKEVITNNHWGQLDRHSTDDSGRDKNYDVADYEAEIVKNYGRDIYEQALKSGESLQYEDGSKRVIYADDTRKDTPCNPKDSTTNGNQAFFYNNLEFKLQMEFTPEAPDEIPPTPLVPGDPCVPSHEESSNGSHLGATKNLQKVMCAKLKGSTEHIVDGEIAWWLYKPSDQSVSMAKAKNGLQLGAVKHFEEKPNSRKWWTRGNGIFPAMKTEPSTYENVYADGLKGNSISYEFEYQYTNHFQETFTATQTMVCTGGWSEPKYDKDGNETRPARCLGKEWLPKLTDPDPANDFPGVGWSSGGRNADWSQIQHPHEKYTLSSEHKRGEEEDVRDNAMDIKLQVGKSAEVKNNVKGSDTIFNEYLKMNANTREDRDTQGTLEIAEHPLDYSLDYGYFESPEFYNVQPFGYYFVPEVDPNIKYEYQNPTEYSYNPYAIAVKFEEPQSWGNGFRVPIRSVDDFYTTYATGFLFSVNGRTGDPEAVAAQEYQGFTGANYRDRVVQAPDKYKSSYYMPIDGNGIMKPNTNYTNKTRIGKIGLSDYTVEYEKNYTFKHYLLGSVFDDTWIAEQHNPLVKVQYPHSVTITLEDGIKIKEAAKDRTMLLHGFRVTDGKDFYDTVRSIIGF